MDPLADAHAQDVRRGVHEEPLNLFALRLDKPLPHMLLQAHHRPLLRTFAHDAGFGQLARRRTHDIVDRPNVVHHDAEDRKRRRARSSGAHTRDTSTQTASMQLSAMPCAIVADGLKPIGHEQWTGKRLALVKFFKTPPGPGGGWASIARHDLDARTL